jgi:hypothetical protein
VAIESAEPVQQQRRRPVPAAREGVPVHAVPGDGARPALRALGDEGGVRELAEEIDAQVGHTAQGEHLHLGAGARQKAAGVQPQLAALSGERQPQRRMAIVALRRGLHRPIHLGRRHSFLARGVQLPHGSPFAEALSASFGPLPDARG